jgi:hypothetical protein
MSRSRALAFAVLALVSKMWWRRSANVRRRRRRAAPVVVSTRHVGVAVATADATAAVGTTAAMVRRQRWRRRPAAVRRRRSGVAGVGRHALQRRRGHLRGRKGVRIGRRAHGEVRIAERVDASGNRVGRDERGAKALLRERIADDGGGTVTGNLDPDRAERDAVEQRGGKVQLQQHDAARRDELLELRFVEPPVECVDLHGIRVGLVCESVGLPVLKRVLRLISAPLLLLLLLLMLRLLVVLHLLRLLLRRTRLRLAWL